MASHNKITNKVLASSQRGEESSHTGHSVPGYSDTGFQPVQFPPSVQSDLFNYLRPEQQEFLKPILRVLKKPAQEELCVALIDYLETGIPEPPVTFNLGVIFMYIIHGCEPKGSDPADRKFLYPLHEVLASSQRDGEGPSGGFAPSVGKTGFASFPHGYSDTAFQAEHREPKSIGTIIKQILNK